MSAGPRTRRTAIEIAVAFLLLFLVTGGGRIVGSDEVTMAELSRAMLHGRIDVPVGATLQGPDGRAYSKNMPGVAVLALPWTAAGELAAAVAPLAPAKRALAARAVVSTFNAFVTALLLALFYWTARSLGAGAGGALAATLLLGLATPVWVYAKSFMAEPLEALGLLAVILGASRVVTADDHRPDRAGAWIAAAGALVAIGSKPSMAPLVLLAMLATPPRAWRRLAIPLAGFAVAMLLGLAYDFARFHSFTETGYGAQGSLAAFRTPLWVGAYGLTFSSGKGVMWFAPGLWLLGAGVPALFRRRAHGGGVPERRVPARIAGVQCLAVAAAALLEYSGFEHWAGDGSFGPRYLIPVLPPLFLLVAFALTAAPPARRRFAWLLAAFGLFVQIGGVGIYFGAEMREVGDYPYTRSLSDPAFMSESHFDPHHTPILGHWRMLVRNADEHLHGEAPRLGGGGAPDPRLGISVEEQHALLHALDFWWLYAGYAGIPAAPRYGVLALLLAGLGFAVARARAAWRAEARAG